MGKKRKHEVIKGVLPENAAGKRRRDRNTVIENVIPKRRTDTQRKLL